MGDNMALIPMTLKSGASAMAPTGGSDLTFTAGPVLPSGIQMLDTSVADFRLRPFVKWNYRPWTQTNAGQYTKAKMTAVLVVPKLIADGTVKYNLFEIRQEFHPESTAAEVLNLGLMGIQMRSNSNASGFWTTGSFA